MIILETFTPLKSPVNFDIMIGDRFYRTIALPLTVGVEYMKTDIMSFVRLKLPSLVNKDFELMPTDSPVYKN